MNTILKPELERGQAVMIGSMGQGGRVIGYEQVGAELKTLVKTVDGEEFPFSPRELRKDTNGVRALERRRDEAERIAEDNQLGVDEDGRPLPSQYGGDN